MEYQNETEPIETIIIDGQLKQVKTVTNTHPETGAHHTFNVYIPLSHFPTQLEAIRANHPNLFDND